LQDGLSPVPLHQPAFRDTCGILVATYRIGKIDMTDDLNPQWERHFEVIAVELLRLAIACGVRLREPGVIERVLRNDASVCGRKNERSFRKMRNLLVAYYDSVGKAVDRIGPEETKKIIEVITEQKKKLRDAAGS
jgi:hypothetical protein